MFYSSHSTVTKLFNLKTVLMFINYIYFEDYDVKLICEKSFSNIHLCVI